MSTVPEHQRCKAWKPRSYALCAIRAPLRLVIGIESKYAMMVAMPGMVIDELE